MKCIMEYIKPKFPAFDLSYVGDKNFIKEDPLLIDEFYYSKSNDYFNNKILNHIIVDCNGNTFKIVGKKDIKGIFTYLPFFKKAEFIFEALEEKYSLNDLKIIFSKIIDDPQIKSNIHKAESIEDLFIGK